MSKDQNTRIDFDASVLSSMVWSLGIIQGLYLGGQSAVDAFVGKAKKQLGIEESEWAYHKNGHELKPQPEKSLCAFET